MMNLYGTNSSVRSVVCLVVGTLLLFGAVGCDSGGDPGVEPNTDDVTIAEYVQQDSDFSTLAAALETADLAQTLSEDGPFTVFAPQNGAFEALTVDALTNDSDLLARVLGFHVVEGDIAIQDIEDGQTEETLQGQELTFQVEGGTVSVNGAEITGRSVQATNGRIHGIGRVLLDVANAAERAKITSQTATLSSVLPDDVVSTLEGDGPVTVFAPVNGAIDDLNADVLTGNDALLRSVLNYHVVEGTAIRSEDISDGQTIDRSGGADLTFQVDEDGNVRVNGALVTTADVETNNGVIHLVDAVMLEPSNIAQRAALTPALDSLTTSLETAGLTSTLEGDGPFTVFAPANASFAGIDYDRLAGDASLLSRVLEYHVVAGQDIQAEDISDGQTVTTVEGTELTFTKKDGTILVNDREVIASPDLSSTNGTVHVVNEVLLGSTNIVQRAALSPPTSRLAALVQEAGLDGSDGLGDESGDKYTVFAPTNTAFEAINAGRFDDDPNLRDKSLQYHVLDGELRAEDIQDGQSEETWEGSDVDFSTFADASPQVNGTDIDVANLKTRNGIIHLIDRVLLEASTVGERIDLLPSHSVLAQALRDTDRRALLDESGSLTESPFTVLAPTNDALEAAEVDTMSSAQLADVLDYHLITNASVASDDIENGQEIETREGETVVFNVSNDGTVTVNDVATVITPDLQSRKNGVVHRIDRVLVPPSLE